MVFPKAVTSLVNRQPAAAAAITGNVLRGTPLLPVRNLSPAPPSPMDVWDFFNSIT